MIVYKFGGASVKDADGIKNLGKIIDETGDNLVIVVSAFGKTTNALEEVLKLWFSGRDYYRQLDELFRYHLDTASSLTGNESQVVKSFIISYSRLRDYLQRKPSLKYDYEYDQIVSYGEIWSTLIVAGYLSYTGKTAEWVDIRELLVTDDRYRDANILWSESTVRISGRFDFSRTRIFVTQGFIGSTVTGDYTTLGREGSDYTAAVMANILGAEKVVVWKDVPGILNADPKWMKIVTRLDEISYKEAVEMSFSGAKVIHPKTIKPLHNKKIPLHVRSFINPSEPGTVIREDATIEIDVPIFIKKEDQILISLLPKDFSFVMGDNLGRVFHAFMVHGIKVNLVQASAVSIDVCADDDRGKIEDLISELRPEYRANYNDDVEMLSVRHYTADSLNEITEGREILLEQRTRKIARFVMRKS